jgi:hypothetical protein
MKQRCAFLRPKRGSGAADHFCLRCAATINPPAGIVDDEQLLLVEVVQHTTPSVLIAKKSYYLR